MPSTLVWSLIIVGLVIIALLGLLIRQQLKGLKALKDEQKSIQDRQERIEAGYRLDIKESLEVIAKVMLDDQVDLSEGCIRIKVLLDHLDPDLHDDERFQIFSTFSQKIAHMPTHDARKEVDKKFLFKLDQQRLQLESAHRTEIRASTQNLLDFLKISS